MRAQTEIHRLLADRGARLWPHYWPGVWTPHCTIAMRLPDEDLRAVRQTVEPLLPIIVTSSGVHAVDTATGTSLAAW